MEEDLPHVPQFIKVHVGQTDQGEGQERLTVPPHREVREQGTLKRGRERERWSERPTPGSREESTSVRTIEILHCIENPLQETNLSLLSNHVQYLTFTQGCPNYLVQA
jgi:hypothetical protein